MEVFFPVLAVCMGGFLLIIYFLTHKTVNGRSLNTGGIRRFWILVNLLAWVYEFFFLIVACGFVNGLNVRFGGGWDELFYFFLLVGIVLLHIVLLAVLIYNRRRTVFFVILVCLPLIPLYMMHADAARGNERNGYTVRGSRAGLYFNQEAFSQRKKLEETARPENSPTGEVFRLWLLKAGQGDVQAQYEVGVCYTLGNGVEQNDSLAIRWFRKAAEGGHVQCQISMGVIYYNGSHGFETDHPEALRWFLKAAGQGDAHAQYLAGRCYSRGEGAERNDGEAFRWLRLAARQGHEEAQELLRKNRQTW